MPIVHIALPSPGVDELIAEITRADATSPVNELGQLALAGTRDATCLVWPDDPTPLGFALVDHRENTIQLGVHPDHRRRGIGTDLALAALAATPTPDHTFWAFGDLPGAAELARRIGFHKARELYIMARDLTPITPAPPPEDVTIDAYTPTDAPAVVAVNAAAFVHHPEQGNLTLADFDSLTQQPWFDPAGLLVARCQGRLLGFHWTKRHSPTEGEVYVLAVHPDAAGRGLGRSLLEAGLAHLHARGMSSVKLYVESSESRVVELYRAATFDVIHTDASYAKDAQ